MRRVLAALTAGALLAAACGLGNGDPVTTTAAPATTASVTSTTDAAATTLQPTTTTTAAPQPISGGSVVIGDDQWPPTLNPYVPGGDNFIVTIVGQSHLAGAYDIDASTRELIPELVVELPTVANGGVVLNDDGTMTVSWSIRDEAVWSDGVPISGEDFAFTVAYRQAANECWDEDAEFRPEPFDLGGTVESVGSKSISIRFDQPGFQHEKLFPWIVPQHAVAGTDYCDDWIYETWPAAGPFVVTGIEQSESIRLARNERYWKVDPATGDQLPYLDFVEFHFIPETEEIIRAFRGREVDVIQPPPSFQTAQALQQVADTELQILQGPVWEHFSFQFGPNNRNATTLNGSRSFRQAVAHALDRDLIVAEAYSGMLPGPLGGLLDTVIPSDTSQPWSVYDYNPERAVALLDTACEQLERDCATEPPRVVFSATSNGDLRVRVADLLVPMLERVGIEVVLDLEDSQLFFGETLDQGTWDMGLWAWVAQLGGSGLVTMFDIFDPDAPPPDGSNYYRWGTVDSSARNDEAVATFRNVLAELRTSYDYDEVKRLAGVLELILADEAVIIPLASRITMGAFRADELTGYQMNPTLAGHTWNIEFWRRLSG